MQKQLHFLASLFVLLMLAVSAMAQETDPLNETVVRNPQQMQEYKAGKNRFPARPRDMWEIGVHGGYLQYNGDVAAQPGYAFGVHVRKSLGYVFSVRASALTGTAYGLNYLPSTTSVASNAALGGNGGLGYGAARQFYYNYKSDYTEISLQGMVNLNNILFHKNRNKWSIFAFAGPALNMYATKYDAKNANGQLYDFSTVASGADVNTADGRNKILNNIKAKLDGTYETAGEKQAGREDYLFGKDKNMHSNIAAVAGFGAAYRLSKRFNIALEGQWTFADDDLYDGYRYNQGGTLSSHWDVPFYGNVRLSYNLGNFKKQTEPLWWINPLDAPYEQAKLIKQNGDWLDSDDDGVPDKLDKEPDTKKGFPVDVRGVALDSDGDGVKDGEDWEPYSAPKSVVDEHGVARKKSNDFDCATCLKQAGVGEWFVPMVHFDYDNYCIKAEFQPQLRQVAMMMKNTSTCIVIEGFTDDRKTGADATALAYNRASAVADYLTTNYGIDKTRMTIKATGEDNIVKNASSESAMYMNRRVEVKIAAQCGEASTPEPANRMNVGSANCSERAPYVPQPAIQIQEPTKFRPAGVIPKR